MPQPPEFDLFMQGTVFFDVVFTGLEAMPARGTEVMVDGMGSCPGGVANLAIAASRLGLRTSLAAAFGDDVYGDFCWSTLAEQEHVDLSCSRRYPGWHSPVTISMVVDRDRAMVTHMHPSPEPVSTMIDELPSARAAFAHLEPEPSEWFDRAVAAGALLFADVGWDAEEKWSPDVLDQLERFHAFLPNSVEAMAYTHTDDPHDALHALADRVPVAVVTCGGQGALAVDSTTGEEEWAPSLPVNAHDPTGAGDVFGAAFVLGTLRGWPLRQRLAVREPVRGAVGAVRGRVAGRTRVGRHRRLAVRATHPRGRRLAYGGRGGGRLRVHRGRVAGVGPDIRAPGPRHDRAGL